MGIDPNTPPLLRSFVLTEDEHLRAVRLADKLTHLLGKEKNLDRVQLAALARVAATLASDQDTGDA